MFLLLNFLNSIKKYISKNTHLEQMVQNGRNQYCILDTNPFIMRRKHQNICLMVCIFAPKNICLLFTIKISDIVNLSALNKGFSQFSLCSESLLRFSIHSLVLCPWRLDHPPEIQPESARVIKSQPELVRVSQSHPDSARVCKSFRQVLDLADFLGPLGGP